MQVLLIHGTGGSPGENWLPWLKTELEKRGYAVLVPKFPTQEQQSLKAWSDVIEALPLEKDIILVGHSVGATFILNLLERRRAHAALLVSAFTGKLNLTAFDELNKTFAERTFDWEKIRGNCKLIELFHSDDDPYVPLSNARDISKHLQADLCIIRRGGHFNAKSGYVKFPLLLERIQALT